MPQVNPLRSLWNRVLTKPLLSESWKRFALFYEKAELEHTGERVRFLFHTLARSRRRHGYLGTVKLCILNVYWRIRDLTPRRRRFRRDQLAFDRRLGVHTWEIIELTDLHIESPNKVHGSCYDPSPYPGVARILAELGIDYHNFTFIDLGSGLGRAAFIAAHFPFRRIVGIEFSPALHAAAQDNLQQCHKELLVQPNIEFLCLDAAKYPIPPAPCIIYMFNPFGADVMRQVMTNLFVSIQHSGQQTFIIYLNPILDSMLCELPFLTKVRSAHFHSVYTVAVPISQT